MIHGDRLLIALDVGACLATSLLGEAETDVLGRNPRGLSPSRVTELIGQHFIFPPLGEVVLDTDTLRGVRVLLAENRAASADIIFDVAPLLRRSAATLESPAEEIESFYDAFFRVFASGEITEAMLKDPVEAPAVPTGQGH